MLWSRSPVKLFGFTGLILVLVRLFFPPADFAGAAQAHFFAHIMDFRMDLTGYGLFEFAAFVFLLSALAYYLVGRLTAHPPSGLLIQLHFWPSLAFATFSVFLAHLVNRIPPTEVGEAVARAPYNLWLTAYTWAFLVFIGIQVLAAIVAIRSVWLGRSAVVPLPRA